MDQHNNSNRWHITYHFVWRPMRAKACLTDEIASRLAALIEEKVKEQEFSALKAHLGIENYSWPNLEQRARTQDLQQLYASVYWFFSEDTHVTSYGLERVFSKSKGTVAFNTNLDLSNLDIEIQTAYASYLELINLCSEKLGFPPQKELGKFKSSEMMIPKTK